MKVQNGKIQQTQFIVMSSQVDIHINKKSKKVNLNEMPIDIEFDILQNIENEPYVVRVLMTLSGNTEKTVSGYVFEIKVGGEYKLSEDLEVMGTNYKHLVNNSAVPCLINETRVFLQTLTSFYPFGSYIMPMIDMKDLWDKKFAKSEKEPDTEAPVNQEK